MRLDLADLEQVSEFAVAVYKRFDQLDLLINNAGAMIPPLGKTKEVYELQFGIDHLSHFGAAKNQAEATQQSGQPPQTARITPPTTLDPQDT